MFFKKKPPPVFNADRMTFSVEKKITTYVFSLQLEPVFRERAKELLRPVMEEFAVAANEKVCAGCRWFIYAHDCGEYWQDSPSEIAEMKARLLSGVPHLSHLMIEDFHMLFLLDAMSAQVFPALYDTELPPYGDALHLQILDAFFTAYRPKDSDAVASAFSDETINSRDLCRLVGEQQVLLKTFLYNDYQAQAKRPAYDVMCAPHIKGEVMACMVDAFQAHGIRLEFTDADEE